MGLDGAIENAEVGDDTTERVEHGVKDEGLQRCIGVSLRSRNTLDDGLQDFFHALACLAGSLNNVGLVTTDKVHNLILDLQRHSCRHVHLVEYRNDFQIIIDCLIEVGDSLCLHALGGIHEQKGTLACSN